MQIIILVVGVLNLIVLLGIAGSLAKLINHVISKNDEKPVEITSVQTRMPPTYDVTVFQGAEPYSDGINTIPPSRNWDGIPKSNN